MLSRYARLVLGREGINIIHTTAEMYPALNRSALLLPFRQTDYSGSVPRDCRAYLTLHAQDPHPLHQSLLITILLPYPTQTRPTLPNPDPSYPTQPRPLSQHQSIPTHQPNPSLNIAHPPQLRHFRLLNRHIIIHHLPTQPPLSKPDPSSNTTDSPPANAAFSS